jgi:saccharopine dehydrogenase-like NADP-dependent oxidoreductase
MKSFTVAVYGAYGHTGRFVIAKLRELGVDLVLSGRNQEKLKEFGRAYPHSSIVAADIEDAASLHNAFHSADIIVNCAGPFLDTAQPIVDVALKLGKHYIDLSAEQRSVLDIYDIFSVAALSAGTLIIPGAAFYGGLADLLGSQLAGSNKKMDELNIYIGLSHWHPTRGTRLTGKRNHYPRLVFTNGNLRPIQNPEQSVWNFPAPIGRKEVVAVPLSETITISKHLNVNNINTSFLSQLRQSNFL